MRSFRDIPIKQKLAVIIIATTIAAALPGGAGIVTFDSILFRGYLERDLSALARIIGDNTMAALSFEDPRSATETLGALRAKPHLVRACIYEPDGAVLAKYVRQGAIARCPQPDQRGGFRFEEKEVTLSYAIAMAEKRLGTLMITYDLEELSERRKLYGTTVAGVLLASGLITFLLSTGLRAQLVYPISQLVGATKAVSETSDYSIRAPKVSGDEMGVLVERFNEMLAGIQRREDDLIAALRDREQALGEAGAARERFRFMAESMPQMVFTATPGGEMEYFNRQWMDFTGISFGQIRSRGWTQFVHPDDIEDGVRLWRRSLRTGEPFSFEHRFRRADGAYRWHLSRVHAMKDSGGGISIWIGSNTDIHEQKEKEAELRRANEDLQQFAYSASHDLQEPIRNLAVYSELVATRYRDVLDEDGQQFLAILREGGNRLSTLIRDLLAYTRAGSPEDDATTLDSAEVLKHTLACLAEAIRESNATVTHDPLPGVYMGEAHLQQLFQNLIGNALKYRTDAPPRIHVSALDLGTEHRFSVRDGGIGIDPQYKEKIFGIFKRLHRGQKYSGTGVGLAICRRVVERYGGRIWVESAPGHGATFFFTVPRHECSNGDRAA